MAKKIKKSSTSVPKKKQGEEGKDSLKRRRTRKHFMDAVTKCLRKSGYTGLTIQDITEKAMYTRPLFYQYFDSIDDLIWSCTEERLATMFRKIEKFKSQKNVSFVDKWKYIFKSMQKDRTYHYALLCRTGSLDYWNRFSDIFASLHEHDLRRCEYPRRMNVPIQLEAKFFSGTIMQALQWWLSKKDAFSDQELATYINTFLHQTPQFLMPKDEATTEEETKTSRARTSTQTEQTVVEQKQSATTTETVETKESKTPRKKAAKKPEKPKETKKTKKTTPSDKTKASTKAKPKKTTAKKTPAKKTTDETADKQTKATKVPASSKATKTPTSTKASKGSKAPKETKTQTPTKEAKAKKATKSKAEVKSTKGSTSSKKVQKETKKAKSTETKEVAAQVDGSTPSQEPKKTKSTTPSKQASTKAAEAPETPPKKVLKETSEKTPEKSVSKATKETKIESKAKKVIKRKKSAPMPKIGEKKKSKPPASPTIPMEPSAKVAPRREWLRRKKDYFASSADLEGPKQRMLSFSAEKSENVPSTKTKQDKTPAKQKKTSTKQKAKSKETTVLKRKSTKAKSVATSKKKSTTPTQQAGKDAKKKTFDRKKLFNQEVEIVKKPKQSEEMKDMLAFWAEKKSKELERSAKAAKRKQELAKQEGAKQETPKKKVAKKKTVKGTSSTTKTVKSKVTKQETPKPEVVKPKTRKQKAVEQALPAQKETQPEVSEPKTVVSSSTPSKTAEKIEKTPEAVESKGTKTTDSTTTTETPAAPVTKSVAPTKPAKPERMAEESVKHLVTPEKESPKKDVASDYSEIKTSLSKGETAKELMVQEPAAVYQKTPSAPEVSETKKGSEESEKRDTKESEKAKTKKSKDTDHKSKKEKSKKGKGSDSDPFAYENMSDGEKKRLKAYHAYRKQLKSDASYVPPRRDSNGHPYEIASAKEGVLVDVAKSFCIGASRTPHYIRKEHPEVSSFRVFLRMEPDEREQEQWENLRSRWFVYENDFLMKRYHLFELPDGRKVGKYDQIQRAEACVPGRFDEQFSHSQARLFHENNSAYTVINDMRFAVKKKSLPFSSLMGKEQNAIFWPTIVGASFPIHVGAPKTFNRLQLHEMAFTKMVHSDQKVEPFGVDVVGQCVLWIEDVLIVRLSSKMKPVYSYVRFSKGIDIKTMPFTSEEVRGEFLHVRGVYRPKSRRIKHRDVEILRVLSEEEVEEHDLAAREAESSKEHARANSKRLKYWKKRKKAPDTDAKATAETQETKTSKSEGEG